MNTPPKPLFVTGIGTGVGKTYVSANLVETMQADYWKPIQSGDLDASDTMKVRSMVKNKTSVFHPEAYRLTQPFSPHKSAELDGIVIDPKKIILPQTQNRLIVEGAGGLMVPLNDTFFMIDLIKQLQAEVVLVVMNYLGSINHTLLSIAMLQHERLPINSVVFNGIKEAYSEELIKKKHPELKYEYLEWRGN
ncbi:dethiobiotin synthase [Mucilaginibacter arboris]|uniref:ATP-dependent dethiobiotin synthetase BioD n=1 Tax=Mucilaginibacter arboris TaxID=2682090 RepID=A0A7K1SYM2_9SPHI|nr:dethiobiotin synthase [Mucilaginibacter arboris]MVN22403.1 dethiobiotin synthase [Mucilaginibacter arboris]